MISASRPLFVLSPFAEVARCNFEIGEAGVDLVRDDPVRLLTLDALAGFGAHRGEERCIAPCEIIDALLVAGRAVKLLAHLEMVAMKDDGAQHRISGCAQRRGRCIGVRPGGHADLGEKRVAIAYRTECVRFA